jgi:hypothetical protein
MGHWKPKNQGALPEGLENSIQTKSGNNFAGSTLGISNSYIKSLTTSDMGFTGGNIFLRFTPDGLLEHRKTEKHWNFRSSLSDTTLHVRNRIRFDPENTYYQTGITTYDGKIKLNSKMGDTYSYMSVRGSANTDRGIDLASFANNFTSRIIVKDQSGINLNLYNTDKTISNEIDIGTAQTNMSLIRGDKSRVFSLNENRLQFITRQGSDIITNFNLDDKFFEYRNAENTQLKINFTSLYFKPGGNNNGYFYFYGNGLEIKNSIIFVPNDVEKSKPFITMTADDEMQFRRNPYQAITLKEIIEKGQIYKQSTEPTIPNESFAFWVDGSTFYLILRSGNVQKKLQFN